MINWYNLAANSLWIFALALALATISFARWEARSTGAKLGETLNLPGWQTPLNIAGVLFCGGLAATSDVTWERVLWLVLGVLFLVQVVMSRLSSQKTDQS